MKLWFCAALAAAIMMCTVVPVWAAPSKITSVKIEIQIEEEDGEPELDVKSKSNKYEVSDVELEGGFFSSASGPGAEISRNTIENAEAPPNQAAICEIELSASEDYYFDTMQQKDIKISGIEGVCTKAVRRDNGTALTLTVQLTGLAHYVGKIQEAYFKDGCAKWEPATNAVVYGISLYKDNRKKGLYRETSGLTYDFTPLMTEPGQYSYKIFPISISGKKGRTIESEIFTLGRGQAEVIRNTNKEFKAGWQKDNDRWQYRTADLVPVQGNWMAEESDWYFFDDEGYMVTDSWITWKNTWYHFEADGKLSQSLKKEEYYDTKSV